MKKMLLVMNPYSGQRRANKYLADVIEMFNRADYEVEIYMTAGPGDGARMTAEKAACKDLVVCCGGDGTFNEVLTGMMRCGADVPIGYIPAGSTNDFAASLGLPTSIPDAAKLILEGKPRKYDVGQFADRYFSYVASFGAFTKASYVTPQNIKNALGHAAYLLEGIQELSQIRKEHVRLELDGQVVEDDFLFGAVSNSTSVGGILTLDPHQVDMADGKFEVLLLRSPLDVTEVSECIRALRNQTYDCAMLTFRTASSIKIYADADMDWTLDGEYEPGHEEIEVKNLCRAVSLIQRVEET